MVRELLASEPSENEIKPSLSQCEVLVHLSTDIEWAHSKYES